MTKVYRLPVGTKVVRCPFCNGPVSYRDGVQFCRCSRIELHRKPGGRRKDRLARR